MSQGQGGQVGTSLEGRGLVANATAPAAAPTAAPAPAAGDRPQFTDENQRQKFSEHEEAQRAARARSNQATIARAVKNSRENPLGKPQEGDHAYEVVGKRGFILKVDGKPLEVPVGGFLYFDPKRAANFPDRLKQISEAPYTKK